MVAVTCPGVAQPAPAISAVTDVFQVAPKSQKQHSNAGRFTTLPKEITFQNVLTLLLLQRPLFQNNLGKPTPDLNDARDNGVWGWQWHQLDHMQTICTSLQTGNHSNTSALNSIKALKAARTS